MSVDTMAHVVVVGGSIAAVTVADSLRLYGFEGRLSVISEEAVPPYSRIPLSKNVLAGSQDVASVLLPQLPDSIDVQLNSQATALDIAARTVTLANSNKVAYDGLVIATGSKPVCLAAPGQTGELVVRTIADAQEIARRAAGASSVVVVGGGFLGMEVASTLLGLGLSVTVIDRDPPLRRLLGDWLSRFVRSAANEAGIRFVQTNHDVALLGSPVTGVRFEDQQLTADLVISAVGDRPATDWLESSGLTLHGGVRIDTCCRVADGIVAAGDVAAVTGIGAGSRRTPHWTSAIEQGRAAARALLNPADRDPYIPDPYFWTEQFGLDIKIAGELPLVGDPQVIEGDLAARTALLHWGGDGAPSATVALNYRIPIIKLKKFRYRAARSPQCS